VKRDGDGDGSPVGMVPLVGIGIMEEPLEGTPVPVLSEGLWYTVLVTVTRVVDVVVLVLVTG
jgi:hypothetical protein